MHSTVIYIDSETGAKITDEELMDEFEALKAESPEEYDYSFREYLRNCLSKNGFLEELRV